MERFLALLRLLGGRRRRYQADDDYQEGYEDVYYYTSKYNTRLLSEWETLCVWGGGGAGREQRPSSITQERTHSGIQATGSRCFVGNNNNQEGSAAGMWRIREKTFSPVLTCPLSLKFCPQSPSKSSESLWPHPPFSSAPQPENLLPMHRQAVVYPPDQQVALKFREEAVALHVIFH